jgi:molybdopterin-guanine dinucleotide biosynthesis protein A
LKCPLAYPGSNKTTRIVLDFKRLFIYGACMSNQACTGVILAGGQNKRFAGTDKTFERVGQATIFEHVYRTFRELFDQLLLVTNHPEKFMAWDIPMAADLYDLRSSLTGLHTGLFYTATPYAFFAACDTPFLKKEMVQAVLDAIEPNLDIVVPQTELGFEPLCAAYSRQCLKPVQALLEKKQLQIQRLFKTMRTLKIPQPSLRKIDPDLISFFNVNTPEDLEQARQMAKGNETA